MAATGEASVVAVTAKPGGGRDHRVAVAHPHRLALGAGSASSTAGEPAGQVGLAELGGPGAGHLAPEHLGQHLVAVADAQDRDPQVEDGRVEGVGVLGVHRGRAAGEDDAHRAPGGHVGGGDAAGHDLREDVGLAHPAGDESGRTGRRSRRPGPGRSLRPEVGHPMPIPWWRCSALPSVWRDGATMTSAFWNSLTSA